MRQLLLAVACALFASCRPLQDVQVSGVKGFEVSRISTSGIEGDVLLNINNPNRLAFTVYKSDFDVTYSGVHLGVARLTKNVRIHGRSEQTYAFRLKSDFKDVNLADVLKLLNGGSRKSELQVKGNLKVGKLMVRKSTPVDLHEPVRLQ